MVKTQDTYFQQEYKKKKKKCYAFPIHETEILFFQFSWSIAQTPKHTLGCNEDGGRLNSHTQKIHQPRVPFLFVFISSKLPVISFIFSYILSIGGKFSWLKIQKAQKGVQWTILTVRLESLTSLQNQFRVSISYLFFQRYFIQTIYIIYKQKYKYSLLLQTTNGITVLIVYDSIQSSISFEQYLFYIIPSLLHCSRSL